MIAHTEDFVKDIQKLLNQFLKDREIFEFNKKFPIRNYGLARVLPALSENDRNQLDVQFSPVKERIQVDRAITYAEKNLGRGNYFNLLVSLAELSILHGKLNFALEILDKVLKESPEENIKADALVALSDLYSRKANWEKSLAVIMQANEIFKNLNEIQGNARCENIIGIIYGEQGKIDNAKSHFERSLKLIDAETNMELAGQVEMNIGVLNCFEKKFEAATRYFEEALIKFNKVGNLIRIAELRYVIAEMNQEENEFDNALKQLDECISVSMEAGYLPVLGVSYLAKARILVMKEEFELASAFADRALEVCHKTDDRLSIAETYKIKGVIERHLKNFDMAENFFMSSLRLNKKLNNSLNEAETSIELGKLYQDMERIEDKNKHLYDALKYYNNIEASEQIQTIEELIDNDN